MKFIKFAQKLLLALLFLGLCSSQKMEAAGDGWFKVAFDGSEVSLVSVNPYNQMQVVAEVDGMAKITIDGGLLWRSTPVPSKIISMGYDPVHPYEMYAGTLTGLYHSSDLGQTWEAFGSDQSRVLPITSVAINNDAIFTTESVGNGSGFEKVFRFERTGVTTELAFPNPYAEVAAANKSKGMVYVGTHDTLYRSSDDGANWQAVAGPGPNGIGAFTGQLIVQNSQIWQSSADGIYQSGDAGATWHQYAGYPKITEFYSNLGSDVVGFAVNGANAFFGITNSYGSKEIYEVNSAAATKLDFHDFPNDVAAGGGYLWAAGRSGLWRQSGLVSNQARVQRPVVIVPGTLGSWSVAGKWELDPIGQTYNNLIKALEDEGYEKGVTLFDFPYNWRQDNNLSAQELLEKIAAIKQICECDKVDVIAHSQGGLVARAYIEGAHYANDVENLVELGTPNAGSVEDYSIWEAGVSVDQDVKVRLGIKLFHIEAIENGYSNLGKYIRDKIPSVGQLLPTYSYIDGRIYPYDYPADAFLEALNSPVNISLLKSRTNLYVVGSDSKKTLTGLQVGESGPGEDWANGKITNKLYGVGDGTVPIDSLQTIAHASLLLNEDHGGLAKHPSQLWLQDILGDQLPDPSSSSDQINRLMLVYVESPVRISITDPQGNQVNDAVNEIDNAFYTGSDAQTQFVTIPNPSEGKYQIRLTGKGEGKYTIGVSVFDDLKGDTGVEKIGITKLNQNDVYQFDRQDNQLALINTDKKNGGAQPILTIATPPTATGFISSNNEEPIQIKDLTKLYPARLVNALPEPATREIKTSRSTNSGNKAAINGWVGTIFLLMLSGSIGLLWQAKKSASGR